MNEKGNTGLIVLVVILVAAIIGGGIYYYLQSKKEIKIISKPTSVATSTSEPIPSEYHIKNVSYYSEKGGFCYGCSTKMILEYSGLSKDQVAEFEKFIKSEGKGGPPDLFLGLEKFDCAEDIYIAYSKNYDNEMAEFYYQIVDNLKERTELFSSQDDALEKLRKLVSSDTPVIAIIDDGNHYVVVTGYDKNNIYVNDPNPDEGGENKKIQREQFLEQWNVSNQEKSTVGEMGYPGDYGMIWLEKNSDDNDSEENDEEDIKDDADDLDDGLGDDDEEDDLDD